MVIIRAMQFDPVSEDLIHVDLQEVAMDRAIQVSVAIHHVGESIGVKDAAGILEMVLREVRVSCLPGNIPEYLEADVTNLNIHDVLTVKDLKVPEGVRVLNDPNQAVVTVAPPAAEEVAAVTAAPTEATAAEPEVLTERQAEGRGRRGREGRRREKEVSGPGRRRTGESGAGVSQHQTQRGPARGGRAGPPHSCALRARRRPRRRVRGAGRASRCT